ncbi:hypothetical protein [Actinomadura rubrisoli]|uniref:Ig-like domain-containing protein n=1 Tax=Actinomadura rubrisoli TaxID=2530368 RepID=A0A4R5BEJ3_9ACTN|nr:hypothetical protein [Actinomadura rubrisoli]TDD82214.1 hypothetical protein E1298_23100 [Actinomadura rubrisoli]
MNPPNRLLLPAAIVTLAVASAVPASASAIAGPPSSTAARTTANAPAAAELRDDDLTYTCDRTYVGKKGKGWGWPNCSGSEGAPKKGPINEKFAITSRKSSDPKFQCEEVEEEGFPAGEATLPEKVVGFNCTQDADD